ncbi:flagellar export chaperone FliS [Dermatobacter hominis]|uniref:flagellar export chaperone FliS n=1 Tax=Dermatobacter hominis TaxID=2884263 RepID=UPI001D129A57|nr:flagellar export chaperone FliS [Dermatobacter hominis]UDY37174.1 flagellar export chaperone FliS [Dermatobacter hominis]
MPLATPLATFRAERTTVSQERLLVLVYERLVRDLADADDAMERSDRAAAHAALIHAQDIVAELDAALDETVWAAAGELSSIYHYLHGRLVQANLAMDRAALADATAAVTPLLDAWTTAWQRLSAVPSAATSDHVLTGTGSIDVAG